MNKANPDNLHVGKVVRRVYSLHGPDEPQTAYTWLILKKISPDRFKCRSLYDNHIEVLPVSYLTQQQYGVKCEVLN